MATTKPKADRRARTAVGLCAVEGLHRAGKILRHINAVALDLIMHHMGRKIDLAWPNKRAVLNVHLFKHARITQAFKNAGVFRMNQSAHMNLAPQAIGERERDQVIFASTTSQGITIQASLLCAQDAGRQVGWERLYELYAPRQPREIALWPRFWLPSRQPLGTRCAGVSSSRGDMLLMCLIGVHKPDANRLGPLFSTIPSHSWTRCWRSLKLAPLPGMSPHLWGFHAIAAPGIPLRKHSSRRLTRRGRKTVLLQDQVCTRDEQFAGWFTEAFEVLQRNRIKEVISDLIYVFVDCGMQF
jgi:hypothetical protein